MEEQQVLLDHIKAIEASNTISSPANSPLISGWWSLLYQSTPEPSSKWDPNTEVEGPFLALFKPITRGIIQGKGEFQEINTPTGKIQNLAKFSLLGRPGFLNIKGRCLIAESKTSAEERTRVDVTFECVDIQVEGLGKIRVPLDWIRPQGWVETTYLDEDFRVGRGDKGSVFVAVRTKGSPIDIR